MLFGGYLTGIVIGAIIAIIINLIGASMMASAAREKGYDSDAHVMAACFWLGIFGYLYAICLPDKILREQNKLLGTLARQNDSMRKSMTAQRIRKSSDDLPDL